MNKRNQDDPVSFKEVDKILNHDVKETKNGKQIIYDVGVIKLNGEKSSVRLNSSEVKSKDENGKLLEYLIDEVTNLEKYNQLQ